MAAPDKAAASRSPGSPRQLHVDQGRGDMVSENRAANERFERNSKALQQQQQTQAAARPAQEQAPKKELSFGPDRQPNRQNHGQLKQEQAKVVSKGDSQQQTGKKELSFGPGREQGQGQSKTQDQGLSR